MQVNNQNSYNRLQEVRKKKTKKKRLHIKEENFAVCTFATAEVEENFLMSEQLCKTKTQGCEIVFISGWKAVCCKENRKKNNTQLFLAAFRVTISLTDFPTGQKQSKRPLCACKQLICLVKRRIG